MRPIETLPRVTLAVHNSELTTRPWCHSHLSKELLHTSHSTPTMPTTPSIAPCNQLWRTSQSHQLAPCGTGIAATARELSRWTRFSTTPRFPYPRTSATLREEDLLVTWVILLEPILRIKSSLEIKIRYLPCRLETILRAPDRSHSIVIAAKASVLALINSASTRLLTFRALQATGYLPYHPLWLRE
jgi:hypothetical protein